jgi:hypothetical protein
MTKQTNARKFILTAGFLIVLFSVAVLPAMALSNLKITDARVTYLKSSTSLTGSENHLSPLRFQTFNRKVF